MADLNGLFRPTNLAKKSKRRKTKTARRTPQRCNRNPSPSNNPSLNLPQPSFVAEAFRYPSGNACLRTESSSRHHTPSAAQSSGCFPRRSHQARVLHWLQSYLPPASFPRAALLRRSRLLLPTIRESLSQSQTSPGIRPRPSPRTRLPLPSTSVSPALSFQPPRPPAPRPDQIPPAPEPPAFPDRPAGN